MRTCFFSFQKTEYSNYYNKIIAKIVINCRKIERKTDFVTEMLQNVQYEQIWQIL